VKTRDDLADLAVDELVEIGGVEAGQAAELIMNARKHWFEEEAKVRSKYGRCNRRAIRRGAEVPVDRLLQQLDQAGIKVDSAEDMISEDASTSFLRICDAVTPR